MDMPLDMEDLCRTCLQTSQQLHDIFDARQELNSVPYAVDFLQNFCKITASNTIRLPTKVCNDCASEIKRAYMFKMQCDRSASTLNRYVEQVLQGKILHTPEKTAKSPVSRPSSTNTQNKTSDDEEIQRKRTRKKVTEKRSVESNNGDVVLIDDDDDDQSSIQTTPKHQHKNMLAISCDCRSTSQLQKPPKITENHPPLAISQILSTQTPPNRESSPCPLIISQIQSGNQVFYVNQPTENSNSTETIVDTEMTPIEEFLIVEVANEEEDADVIDGTSNKENELIKVQISDKNTTDIQRSNDSTDDVIEIDDDPIEKESFICHICSAAFPNEEAYLNHVIVHKDSPKTSDHFSYSIITPSSSKKVQFIPVDNFLCHTCRKMISGCANYVKHAWACRKRKQNEKDASFKLPSKLAQDPTVAGRSIPIVDRFKCRKCSRLFVGLHNFMTHVRQCQKIDSSRNLPDPVTCGDVAPFLNRFLCDGCKVVLVGGISSFEDHVKNCKKLNGESVDIEAVLLKDGIECAECATVFVDRTSFDDHVVESHMSRRDKYICGVCDIGLPLSEFLAHINGVLCDQFKCKQCIESLFTTATCSIHKSIKPLTSR